MKTSTILLTGMIGLSASIYAQDNNLVMNGSFENVSGMVHNTGIDCLTDSVTSSNNTTVDFFTKKSCSAEYSVPKNYMGTQEAKAGDNYAGIIAYYGDEAGVFKTRPGYQKYSEYIQLKLREPLTAGAVYMVSFNASLAEGSAYAVSGLGVYFTSTKMNVQNNAFLKVTPNIVSTDVIKSNDWVTFTGAYVATGGERYLTLGCFQDYMDTIKVIAPNTNNSRKAYYYIDNVSMAPSVKTDDIQDVSMILYGNCYQLKNLNFETDKATILATSYDELNSLVHFLKTYPSVSVYIDGHTDKTGTEQHNDKLSEDRSVSVKDYLVKNGIKENRLKARGLGESQPIDTKHDDSYVNRRVEITVCEVK